MPYSFDDIVNKHYSERCSIIREIGHERNLITLLNTALLDDDQEKIDILKQALNQTGCRYKIVNAAEVIQSKSRLRIVYLLPHTVISGGVKLVVEQANKLAAKGQEVVIYSHCPQPEWIECKVPLFLVHPDNKLSDLILSADVVVAGSWDCVADCTKIKAPIKYLLADTNREIFNIPQLSDDVRKIMNTAYTLPVRIITGSRAMKELTEALFERKCTLISNGMERSLFYPGSKLMEDKTCLNILLIGDDSDSSNRNEMILGALYSLKEMGYRFKIKWVTPTKLKKNYSLLELDIEEYIAQTQSQIAEIYRSSDIYVRGALYGSFDLPPLEAMACGCTVITSRSFGTKEYAVDGHNCLVFEPDNVYHLVERLETLLKDRELRLKLRENAFVTARKYSLSRTIRTLERNINASVCSTFQAIRC